MSSGVAGACGAMDSGLGSMQRTLLRPTVYRQPIARWTIQSLLPVARPGSRGGEAITHDRGQGEVGVCGRPAEQFQLNLGSLFEVRIVGNPGDRPAPGGEVLLEAVQVHGALAAGTDGREHDDRVAHEV